MDEELPVERMHDDDIFDLTKQDIPNEMVKLVRTKHGTITLNRRGVFNMACKGFTATDIGDMFGVTDRTIKENFAFELKAGRGLIGPRLKVNLLRQAMDQNKPNPTLLMFALKNYTNLRDEGMLADSDTEIPEFLVERPKFKHLSDLTDSERDELEGNNATD